MRTLALGSLASVTLGSAALAQQAQPSFVWTGWYGGLTVGGSLGSRHTTLKPTGDCGADNVICFGPAQNGFLPFAWNGGPLLPPNTTPGGPQPWPGRLGSGAFQSAFGAIAGYHAQVHPLLVLGVENQFNLFGQRKAGLYAFDQSYNQGYSGTTERTDTVRVSSGVRWLDLATARAGLSLDRTLFYVKGGLAFGSARVATSASSTEAFNDGYGSYNTATHWAGSRTRTTGGLAVGAGMEQMFGDKVSLRIDAAYYDLGRMTATAHGRTLRSTDNVTLGPGDPQAYSATRRMDGVLLSTGVIFHF